MAGKHRRKAASQARKRAALPGWPYDPPALAVAASLYVQAPSWRAYAGRAPVTCARWRRGIIISRQERWRLPQRINSDLRVLHWRIGICVAVPASTGLHQSRPGPARATQTDHASRRFGLLSHARQLPACKEEQHDGVREEICCLSYQPCCHSWRCASCRTTQLCPVPSPVCVSDYDLMGSGSSNAQQARHAFIHVYHQQCGGTTISTERTGRALAH